MRNPTVVLGGAPWGFVCVRKVSISTTTDIQPVVAAHLENYPARPVMLPWRERVTANLVMTSVTGRSS
jgi:hypothetical protein